MGYSEYERGKEIGRQGLGQVADATDLDTNLGYLDGKREREAEEAYSLA